MTTFRLSISKRLVLVLTNVTLHVLVPAPAHAHAYAYAYADVLHIIRAGACLS